MFYNMNASKMLRQGILVFCLFLVVLIGKAQISVVVGKSSEQTAGASDLKQMFSGSMMTWPGGARVIIVDQQENEISKTFHEKFVGKSLSRVRMEWMKLVLSGQASAPRKCTDDDAVKAFVQANSNAVGFISSSAIDGTVKELCRVSAQSKVEYQVWNGMLHHRRA
jgi:ABC-type phosphate transport system substrate-binding protein